MALKLYGDNKSIVPRMSIKDFLFNLWLKWKYRKYKYIFWGKRAHIKECFCKTISVKKATEQDFQDFGRKIGKDVFVDGIQPTMQMVRNKKTGRVVACPGNKVKELFNSDDFEIVESEIKNTPPTVLSPDNLYYPRREKLTKIEESEDE